MSNNFLLEIRTVYEIMRQKMVQPDVAENTQFSCPKLNAKIFYYFFHVHNGYANLPLCYVVRALPVLKNYLDAFGGIYQCIS
jgi:hypothetical protein